MEALGMQNLQIPDSAITASSSYNAISFAPYIGRLHFVSAGSGKYGSWAAGTNNEFQWLQIDCGSWTKISAVATQGRQDADQYVKTYTLSFSYDEVFWETVKNEHDITQVQKLGINIQDQALFCRSIPNPPAKQIVSTIFECKEAVVMNLK